METIEPRNASESAERKLDEDNNDAAGESVYLPLHLTEQILRSINPLESARFATVCKSWAATISERLAAGFVPHLFVSGTQEEKLRHNQRGVIVSVPLDGKARQPSAAVISSRVRRSDTMDRPCIGSTPDGRLAFFCDWTSRVLLVNPVTGASQRNHLPGHLPGLTLGTTPVLVTRGRCDDSLFFCSVDDVTDELLLWQWAGAGCNDVRTYRLSLARNVRYPREIVSVIECKGCFYLMHKDGCLSMIDITMPPPFRMVMLPVPGRAAYDRESYLLESDGEILFVLTLRAVKNVECSSCGQIRSRIVIDRFVVYMLSVGDKRWTKVTKLAGDRALFVSPVSSFAFRAPGTVGCMSNCVYFIADRRYCPNCDFLSENTWALYSMVDEKVMFEHAFTTEKATTKQFWFVPSVV